MPIRNFFSRKENDGDNYYAKNAAKFAKTPVLPPAASPKSRRERFAAFLKSRKDRVAAFLKSRKDRAPETQKVNKDYTTDINNMNDAFGHKNPHSPQSGYNAINSDGHQLGGHRRRLGCRRRKASRKRRR